MSDDFPISERPTSPPKSPEPNDISYSDPGDLESLPPGPTKNVAVRIENLRKDVGELRDLTYAFGTKAEEAQKYMHTVAGAVVETVKANQKREQGFDGMLAQLKKELFDRDELRERQQSVRDAVREDAEKQREQNLDRRFAGFDTNLESIRNYQRETRSMVVNLMQEVAELKNEQQETRTEAHAAHLEAQAAQTQILALATTVDTIKGELEKVKVIVETTGVEISSNVIGTKPNNVTG
jgi:chromosome segregation ATPase